MMSIITLIALSNFVVLSQGYSHIFHDEALCDFSIMRLPKKPASVLKVPKILNLKSDGINILALVCDAPKKPIPFHNSQCSTSCLFNEQTQQIVQGSGPGAFVVDNVDPSEVSLVLNNPPRCNNVENYTIKIKIIKSDTTRSPRLNVIAECELEIEILDSDYEPQCTFLLPSKKLIDLRPLKGKKVSTSTNYGDIEISLCGSNSKCGSTTSGCVKDNATNKFSIGTTETIRTQYNMLSNTVSVVASSKENGPKRSMEVRIICNWAEPYLSNLVLLNKTQDSRRYKFQVDSSFGCVKLPFNCVVRDEPHHLTYDLKGLYKANGYTVQLNGKYIRLNICGGLNLKVSKNNCTLENSQVCEVAGNTYINRGSSPIFEVMSDSDDNWVQLKLTNGDRCNADETYSTVIDLKCSGVDEEPTYLSQDGCITKMVWKTRKACPKLEKSSRSCSLSTYFGHVNIAELHGSEDKVLQFTTGEKFVFNICGNLHSNCTGRNDVVGCLTSGKNEKIVGYNSPTLSYANEQLVLKYLGEECDKHYGNYTFLINLICSLADTPKQTEVKKENKCSFVAYVYSKSACFQKDSVKCMFEDNNLRYNLNNLVGKDKNYVVKDSRNKDITYVLNVCASIINEHGKVSPLDAMVYMMNKTEPRIWRRYTSLGKVASPSLENGKLVIHSILGQMKGDNYLNSKIYFECSKKNEPLVFLGVKKGGTYEFLWKTYESCPKVKPGGFCVVGSGDNALEISNDQIDLQISPQVNYSLSLCNDEFQKCSGGACSEGITTRKELQNEEGTVIELHLNKSTECGDVSQINVLKFLIFCDKNEEGMKVTQSGDVKNCELQLNVKTKSACVKIRRDVRVEPADEPAKEAQENVVTEKIERHIKPTPAQTCSNLNMKKFRSFEVKKKYNYLLNFDGSLGQCEGRICRNGHVLVHFIEECPVIERNDSFTKMTYLLKDACDLKDNQTGALFKKDYLIQILFRQRNKLEVSVLEESECKVVIVYNEDGLFEDSTLSSSSSSSLLIISVVTFILLCLVIFVSWLYKKITFTRSNYDPMNGSCTNILMEHSKLS